MKSFGIDWFGLDLDNKFFNDLNGFLSNHIWLKEIYSTLTLNVQTYFMACSVNRKQGKEIWLYLLKILPLTVIFKVLITYYSSSLGNISMVLEFIFLLLVITKLNYKKFLHASIVMICLIIYQGISLATRSLELKAHSYGFVVTQILSIDLYLLLYLHKEMEVNVMGDGTWFFFGFTEWIYGVSGFIVGIFIGHPILKYREYKMKGKAIEDARKAKKELRKVGAR